MDPGRANERKVRDNDDDDDDDDDEIEEEDEENNDDAGILGYWRRAVGNWERFITTFAYMIQTLLTWSVRAGTQTKVKGVPSKAYDLLKEQIH